MNNLLSFSAFVDQIPDSIQTAQIRQIAQQCTADGGPAVARARVWYYSLTGERIEVDCGGVIERGVSEQTNNIAQLSLTPNPANDHVLVQLNSKGLATEGRLDIFSANGVLQKVVQVPIQSTVIEVLTTDLSNGVYFCRLISEGRLIAAAKFSIQH